MNRTHIHFAAGLSGETGVISGMRKSCKVGVRHPVSTPSHR